MAHTYASIFIHCVFSTKDRAPRIPAERALELYAYLSGIARSEGFSLITAGGTANHVHLLIALPAAYALARAAQKLKGSSSRWMGQDFSWQEGYGAFSVSPSHVPVVKRYIQNQETHHCKRNFEEEFVALLHNCGIEFDERYVFGQNGNRVVPMGLDLILIALDPTLKRGANKRCASGAKISSQDKPALEQEEGNESHHRTHRRLRRSLLP